MTQFLFITDLDHTLVGNDEALDRLNQKLTWHRDTFGTKIVYATGRSRYSFQQLCREKPLLPPDALVASVGTAIYPKAGEEADPGWSDVLAKGWDRDRVLKTAARFAEMSPQTETEQGEFKASYHLPNPIAPDIIPPLKQALEDQGLEINLIYSGGIDLDIVPKHADKGKAIAFLRQRWSFQADRIVACGDSGNDRALFCMGDTRGIIVGNAKPELLEWHSENPSPHRYLAKAHCAAGILEGLEYFGFW